MHEVGIIASTLDLIRREALRHGAAHVERVTLRVGTLSGAEPEALQFAFSAATPGTLADGAELEIEVVPARARCRDCREDFVVDSGFIYACPQCGAFSGDVRSGRELELTRLEFTPFVPLPRHVLHD